MSQIALACAAAVGALVLTLQHRPLVFPIIALVAAGLELLIALKIVHLSLGSVPLELLLGAALAIAGAVVWVRSSGKNVVSAATVVTLIGILQVLSGLHLR